MEEPLRKEIIESMLTNSKITPDNNFIVVEQIIHPKMHKIASLLDGVRGVNGIGPFQGFTEKTTILAFTPEAIFFTIIPSLADAEEGNYSFTRINNPDVKELKIYHKHGQTHIEFDYPTGNFRSRLTVLQGFWGDFVTNNLKHLAAGGFYGRIEPSKL